MKKMLLSVLLIVMIVMNLTPVFGAEIVSSDWARSYVEKAAAENLVPDTLLKKANEVASRKEFCELIMTFYETKTGAPVEAAGVSPFEDETSPRVAAAVELGFFSGVSATKFNPEGNVSREQMAAVMTRLADKMGYHLDYYQSSDEKFEDSADIGAWAYESVYVLKKNGIVSGDNRNYFNPGGDTTIEQIIIVLSNIQDLAPELEADNNGGDEESGGEGRDTEASTEANTETKADTKPVPIPQTANTSFAQPETLKIGTLGVSLGESKERLVNKFGEPSRIDTSAYGFERYIYNEDYNNFVMIGLENGIVVELYTNSKNFTYGGLSPSAKFSGMNFKDFYEYSSERAVYSNSLYQLKIYFDGSEDKYVDGVYLLAAGYEIPDSAYTAENAAVLEEELLDIINSMRVKNGLEILVRDKTSDEVAKKHAQEMSSVLRGSYLSLQGVDPFQRMTRAGIDYSLAAENICTEADGEAKDIYAWWMNHVATRSNLLDENFTHAGIGGAGAPARSRFYAVVDVFCE